jgi:hypothetical protein
MKNADEMASAAMRGSTTERSKDSTSADSNIGACAVGTS